MTDLLITGAQSLIFNPFGAPVRSSLIVNANLALLNQIEFMDAGYARALAGNENPGINGGKVAFFRGIEGGIGAGDLWGFNFLVQSLPGHTRQILGGEIDINNTSRDTGPSIMGGATGYNTALIFTSNAGVLPITAAQWVDGQRAFHHAYVVGPQGAIDNDFYSVSQAACLIRAEGTKSWGIDFTGCTILSQDAMRFTTGHKIANVNTAKTTEHSLIEGDDAQNTYIGRGAAGRVRVDKAVVVTSDVRSKVNISPLQARHWPDVLDEAFKIEPIFFSHKDTQHEQELGFSAQDLDELGLPGLVHKDADRWGVAGASPLVALLWAMVQRQQARIDALEAKCSHL